MMFSAISGFVWLLLVSIVAMLPYPAHRPYAMALLLLFPVVLGFVAWEIGVWWALALFAAALSLYRYPAKYLGRYLMRRLSVLPIFRQR